MKNLLLLTSILFLISAELIAQTVPQGMRFQAIARNLNGSLLMDKELNVQVDLFAPGTQDRIFYTETHNVRSTDLGLVDFVIGEGTQPSAKFSDIPWLTEEMWVRISVKTPEDRAFQIISSGQLYTVPYALYAESAGKVAEQGGRTPGLGQNAINWTLEGNYNSQERNDGNPVLGTTDANDLVIVTNNIPRLTIDADGAITFLVDVDLNGDLNVDGNTTLNGSLDVTNMAPTHLTGTLTVDKETDLNDQLSVENMSSTVLTGTLDVGKGMQVGEETTLNSSLDVTGMSPTTLSGTLTVDKATTLQDDLTVGSSSSTSLTGTLDVDQSLNVDGSTTMNSPLTVTSMSSSTFTGMLTVAMQTILNDDLTVENAAPTHLTGELTVDGNASFGGGTIDAPLDVLNMHPTHLTGTLTVDKLSSLETGLMVSGNGEVGPNSDYLAFFDNITGGTKDGIAVKINTNDLNTENNFMTFYKGDGDSRAGRIEGYELGDMADVPLPTGEEIWGAVCWALADYNPLTIYWTQMAGYFNLFAEGWNATTIPSFDIEDIPPFAIPDVPALAIPDVPAFVIPNVPSFTIPDIPGVTIPNIPELEIGPYLCAEICFCICADFSACCCYDVCLIPEMTLFSGINIPDFPGIAIPDFPGIVIPDFPGIPIPDFPGIAIPDFPGLVIPEVPEIDFAEVFGECPTLPTLNDILVEEGVCPEMNLFDPEEGYLKDLAEYAYEHRLQNLISLDPVKLLGSALAWGLTTAVLNDGVVYGSKGADYAEYLPKQYATEQFMKGDVVGVFNGRISKVTENADQILAITSQPLVLGNMPEDGETEDYEKVAFLGQIPVYVQGPVRTGDYIIPSGKNDGIAKAIPAESVTADMLSDILGTAWSEYPGTGITLINTSIGLRPMEISVVLKQQGQLEDGLQEQIDMQKMKSLELSNDIEDLKRSLRLTASGNNP